MKSLSLEALKEELRGYYPKQSVTQLNHSIESVVNLLTLFQLN